MAYGDCLRRHPGGVWYWRWVVPTCLQVHLPAGEVARSLFTTNRREAVARSLPLRLAVQHLVQVAQAGIQVSADQMKALLERARRDSKLAQEREAQEEEIFQAHKARVRAEQLLQQALAGRHHPAPPPAIVVDVATAPALSACIAAFCSEKQASSAWTPKTLERWQFTFRLLLEGLGDRPIDQVRREDVTAFMGRLRRLPSNAQKMPSLAGKTFTELTDTTGFNVIGDGTVNDFMGRVSSFFKWAMKDDRHQLRSNPAESISVKHVKRTKRRPFTDEQLVALFSHESYRTGRFLHPHYFWLMPMSMLTGMRLNELCQLRLADFIEVDGVPVIRCADEGEGQRGKNINATRRVPVHSELVRLGLLRWVAEQRAAGQTQLFPELKPGRDGHGQAASKWFSRYREACGITGKQTEVFHSFRHLFISSRMNGDVAPHKIAAIVGHETGLITGDVYWSDKEAAGLSAVVNAVGLPASVVGLVPPIEQVQFVKVPRRPPSRLGARKSREKRIADAAARRAGKPT